MDWSTPTEIKETRRVSDTMLTYRREVGEETRRWALELAKESWSFYPFWAKTTSFFYLLTKKLPISTSDNCRVISTEINRICQTILFLYSLFSQKK
jgi:hypothetical protein